MSTQAPVNVPALGRSIVRLADAIGNLNPRRGGRILEIGQMQEIQVFASICRIDNPNEMLPASCPHCQAQTTVARVVLEIAAESWACDACRSKAQKEERHAKARKYWEKVCPPLYRETDPNHADFPKAVLEELLKVDPTQSLFLYGPTGACKTRMAMRLVRHHIIRGDSVAVIWPHQLRTLQQGYDNSRFEDAENVDVLVLDDALLTACRESRLVDTVKMLVDARMMKMKRTIITSQIGTEDDLKDGKEFGEAKSADLERIRALLRRIREKFKIVPLVKADTSTTEGL
jgi:DNA replication protein DnaC